MSKNFTFVFILIAFPEVLFGQNLITNGDFESGHTGWYGGEIVTSNPHSGNNCLYVRDDSRNANMPAYSDFINIDRSQYFRLSLWHRSGKDGSKILVAINQYDSSGKWISGNNIDIVVTSYLGWNPLAIPLKSFNANTSKVRIFLYPAVWSEAGELTGEAFFDDITFERIDMTDLTYGNYVFKNSDLGIWQSPVTQKVLRNMHPSEKNTKSRIEFYAARGEYEAFQVVITPNKDVNLKGISISDLSGPDGTIASALFSAKMAEYVNITHPTDNGSFRGEVPDPLVDLRFPLALKEGQSQPFYFILRIPEKSAGGEYSGKLTFLFEEAGTTEVPVYVRVWDFELPKKHSLKTAYGFYSLNLLDYYHNLSGNYDDIRQVAELYLLDMSEHRVSPYDPFLDSRYKINISETGWVGGNLLRDESSNHYLEVRDESASVCVNAYTFRRIRLDKSSDYILSFRVRGETGQDYLVSVNQYDADNKWISGANIDYVYNSAGDWEEKSVTITKDRFREIAEYISVRLFARKWTPDCALTGVTYFDDIVLRAGTSDENLIFNGDFEADIDDILVDIDFSAFDKRAEYVFDVLNFDSFIFVPYNFASGSYEGSNTDVDILGYKWGTPEYEKLFIRITQETTRHLKEKDVLKYAYAYWYDEPSPQNYELVRYGMDLIHRSEPDLKRLLTEQAEDMLIGYVDIWTPILDMYDPLWASERQKDGDEVWWYVCTGPRSPYPNNFIDHQAIEHRILFWMNWKFGVTGSLYWSINYWDDCISDNGYQNPYLDPQSYVCGRPGFFWGNGDGRLIYPPYNYTDKLRRIEKPVTSIRWELIRDGIEDYEYFHLLSDLVSQAEQRGFSGELIAEAKGLLNIPSQIVDSLISYTDDPDLLEEYRIMLGNSIEAISVLLKNGSSDAGYGDNECGYCDIGPDSDLPVSDGNDFADDQTPVYDASVDVSVDANRDTLSYEDVSAPDDAVLHPDNIIDNGDEVSTGCGCNLISY